MGHIAIITHAVRLVDAYRSESQLRVRSSCKKRCILPGRYSMESHKNVLKACIAVLGTRRNVTTNVSGSAFCRPRRTGRRVPAASLLHRSAASCQSTKH
eukprot:2091691-Prymnesium_polylepis.1